MKESKITLKEPIEWGSESIKELNFKTPKAKHVKEMNLTNPGVKDILLLASKLSGVSLSALDELGMEDLMAVTEIVGNLLTGGQKIGENA